MKSLKRISPNLYKRHLPYLIFILISLIFFFPVIFQKKIPLPSDALVGAHVPWTEISWPDYPAGVPIKNYEITDAISQFYPWKSLVGEFWRNGKVPLWNSYMLSGTPFLATWHSATIYPLNVVYLFANNINAWSLFVFLQIILSMVFMFWFLRELNLKRIASTFGAVIFAFSGYMVGWLEFTTGGHAGLWLPLILTFLLKFKKTNNKKWGLGIPFIIFMQITAGDFQVFFYSSAIFFLLVIYLSRFKEKIFVLKSSLLYLLGVLLSMPQLLPTTELFLNSVRTDDPYISNFYFGLMRWENITNFIWPDFFGNVVTRNYWAKFDNREYLAFTGTTSIIFVIYAFLTKKRRIEKFFWSILLISLLFLFPTPIAFLPYKLKIPGLGTSPATRILFLVDFSLVVIAAFGFSRWLENKSKIILKIIFLLFIVSLGVGLGLYLSLNILEAHSSQPIQMSNNLKVALRNMLPQTAVLIVLGVLFFLRQKLFNLSNINLQKRTEKLIIVGLVLISFVEMLRFSFKNTTFAPRKFVFPDTQITRFLTSKNEPFRIAGGIPLNLFMPFGLHSVEGFDSLYSRNYAEWLSLVNHQNTKHLSRRFGEIDDFSSPFTNYANLRYIIDYKKNPLGGISEKGELEKGITTPRYKEIFQEGRIKVYENKQSLPKVWATTNFRIANSEQELLNHLLYTEFDKPEIVFTEFPEATLLNEKVSYKVDNYLETFNKIDFSITTDSDSLLYLSESYYPGWKASIDGEDTKIYKANYAFQAVELSKGKHNIEFVYKPASFAIGVWSFFIVLILLILIYGLEFRRER